MYKNMYSFKQFQGFVLIPPLSKQEDNKPCAVGAVIPYPKPCYETSRPIRPQLSQPRNDSLDPRIAVCHLCAAPADEQAAAHRRVDLKTGWSRSSQMPTQPSWKQEL